MLKLPLSPAQNRIKEYLQNNILKNTPPPWLSLSKGGRVVNLSIPMSDVSIASRAPTPATTATLPPIGLGSIPPPLPRPACLLRALSIRKVMGRGGSIRSQIREGAVGISPAGIKFIHAGNH